MNEEIYDEKYFSTLNYTNYLTRQDRYLKTAKELTELLSSISLINKEAFILDFGCSVGFLLDGLKSLGYTYCSGYDISKWASSIATKKGHELITFEHKYYTRDVVFCLDVLEHMTDEEIEEAFNKIDTPTLVLRIPCSEDGKDFHLEVSRRDKTHINCKTKNKWETLLKQLGFKTFLTLNLLTIYDSPGVMCCICLK